MLPDAVSFSPNILPQANYYNYKPGYQIPMMANYVTEKPAMKPLSSAPKPASITSPLKYSDLLQLLPSQQVTDVTIQQPSSDSRALPVALATVNQNKRIPVKLPRDTKAFSDKLDKHGIPYAFTERKKPTKEKVSDTTAIAVEDVVIPMLLLGAAIAGLTRWQSKQDEIQQMKQTHQVLKDYHKPTAPKSKLNTKDILHLYDTNVRQAVKAYQDNHSNFLIAVGPPATGKTALLDALTADTWDDKTLILDIGSTDASEVRQLLNRLYGGNQREREQAQKSLIKLSLSDQPFLKRLWASLKPEKDDFPYKTILLVGDEIEKVSPALDELITKSFDNPRNDLPTIKLLASANALPGFSSATRSRLGRSVVLVDYCKPEEMKQYWLDWYSKQNIKLTDKQKNELLTVLQDNPGYSLRTLFKENGLADQLKQNLEKDKKLSPVEELKKLLSQTTLDDNEIAGLARLTLMEKTFEDNQIISEEQNIEKTRLALAGLQVNEEPLQSIGVSRRYNGKDWYKKICNAINIERELDEDSSEEEPETFEKLSTQTNDFQKLLESIYRALRDNKTERD